MLMSSLVERSQTKVSVSHVLVKINYNCCIMMADSAVVSIEIYMSLFFFSKRPAPKFDARVSILILESFPCPISSTIYVISSLNYDLVEEL